LDGVRLRVICGPTGAGKSDLALGLAESLGGAIVSADSRQIFRGFDVGTAKPTPEERRRVPHHGVDLALPTERYTAAHWRYDAEGWIAEIERTGRTPVIVGGTGFYLRALFAPLFREPPIDEGRRAALREYLATLPDEELRRWSGMLDPSRASLGPVQMRRAIEVALLTGERISDMFATRADASRHAPRYLVVDPGDRLEARIAERIDVMFSAGWVDEVRTLMRDVPPDAPAWHATGYDSVRRLASGQIDERAARSEILIDTRQYAKRQRTWFRHQLPPELVTRIDPLDPDAPAWARRWWDGEVLAEVQA
jgi:tRNA dimethylallyltransferase